MMTELSQLEHLISEASALLRDKGLVLEAGNLQRLGGVEIKKIKTCSEQYRSLVSRAFERFTDNDMQPPSLALRQWLKDAERIFLEPNDEGK